MPIATTLPSTSITLRFPPSPAEEADEEAYQLLELPAEILKQVEANPASPLSLTIRGRPSDDAVLCTPSRTYAIRSVGISNSLLVCRAPPSSAASTPATSGANAQLEIRDTSHEILELVPHAPNLERIRAVLRPSAWKGLGHDVGVVQAGAGAGVKRGRDGERKEYSMDQMRSVIQASEEELAKGLKERNVVEINTLGPLLSLILNLITIHGEDTSHIVSALRDHDVPPELSRAVLDLFAFDTRAMVRIIGLGLLEQGQTQPLDQFEHAWHVATGDCAEQADVKTLEGHYLLDTPPVSALGHSAPIITFFPVHTLPLAPAIRFADLFLTRTPWRPDDMQPFLRGLYREGDTKERDKLVAKFVRVVKDKSGVWWYPRRSS